MAPHWVRLGLNPCPYLVSVSGAQSSTSFQSREEFSTIIFGLSSQKFAIPWSANVGTIPFPAGEEKLVEIPLDEEGEAVGAVILHGWIVPSGISWSRIVSGTEGYGGWELRLILSCHYQIFLFGISLTISLFATYTQGCILMPIILARKGFRVDCVFLQIIFSGSSPGLGGIETTILPFCLRWFLHFTWISRILCFHSFVLLLSTLEC